MGAPTAPCFTSPAFRRPASRSASLLLGSARAQTPLDRSKMPPIGKVPELRVPVWTKSRLSNGAELMVSERHDLPLVSFSITFSGGADQFEAANLRGVALRTRSVTKNARRVFPR
jgi:hypothetical protein